MATQPVSGYEHGPDATLRAARLALARADDAHSVVLVEGISDQIAVETLAERMGCTLADERVVVVPVGGAQAVKHVVPRFASRADLRLIGLVDRAEADHYSRALGDGGFPNAPVFVCDADLEDELIRSFDEADLEAVLDAEGDLDAFRTFQKQPAWRDRPFAAQMHRWLRSKARRTARYAHVLVVEASEERVPPPLAALVDSL